MNSLFEHWATNTLDSRSFFQSVGSIEDDIMDIAREGAACENLINVSSEESC